MNKEKEISRYIDDLNTGRKPKDHKNNIEDKEYKQLMETVRKVHSLREVEYPDDLFQKRLIASLLKEAHMDKGVMNKKKVPGNKLIKRTLIFTSAVAAAALLLFVTLDKVMPGENMNIVYAMEKAMKEIYAYHGILEVTQINELGETMTQSKREVWADLKGSYYLKELEGSSTGLITVNNGQKKWQITPEENKVNIFNAFPDPYRFTFELGNELDAVRDALTIKIIGDEYIGERLATKLEVTPDGGASYYLWVDAQTDLPLQRESAMQNAIQYKVTYTSIEFLDSIPEDLFAYALPEGYSEVEIDPEQVVATLEEAEDIAGFQPKFPDDVSGGFTLDYIAVVKNLSAIKLYYNNEMNNKKVVVVQSKVSGDFIPESGAILGSVGENQAEIITTDLSSSIRWQEQGMEYCVIGDITVEDLTSFAEAFSAGEVVIPDSTEAAYEPQVKVEVDLAIEENEQKSVDAGHSPWKLDPAFVTQVFASLLLSPEGIVGEYPIAYEDIIIIENNGVDAVAEIKDKDSLAKYVYLKRLVRQDDTGIWSVVGYDPAE